MGYNKYEIRLMIEETLVDKGIITSSQISEDLKEYYKDRDVFIQVEQIGP